jgi:hypothetical protein
MVCHHVTLMAWWRISAASGPLTGCYGKTAIDSVVQ